MEEEKEMEEKLSKSLTVVKLKKELKSLGIKGFSNKNKEYLVKLLIKERKKVSKKPKIVVIEEEKVPPKKPKIIVIEEEEIPPENIEEMIKNIEIIPITEGVEIEEKMFEGEKIEEIVKFPEAIGILEHEDIEKVLEKIQVEDEDNDITHLTILTKEIQKCLGLVF